MFAWAVQTLDSKARKQLAIQRLSAGRYMIDGRECSLRFGSAPAGQSGELLLREVGLKGEEVKLSTYLTQAANVASSLQDIQASQANAAWLNAMFTDTSTMACVNGEVEDAGAERTRSMLLACMEAGLQTKASF